VGSCFPAPSGAGQTVDFMGRSVFQELDTHRDHEPLSEEDRKRPSSRPSPGGRRRIRAAGFLEQGEGFAGMGFDGSDGRDPARSCG